MNGGFVAVSLAALALTAFSASAQSVEPAAVNSEYENVKVYKDKTIKDLVEGSVDGSVSWKTLLRVRVEVEDTETGTSFIPEFDESVAALDGKEIEILGFMFPLVPTTDIPDAEDHFLLSSIPASCPYFHIYGGQIIEVIATKEVEFDEDNPVRIRGRFELLHENRDGLFYKMTGVTPVR